VTDFSCISLLLILVCFFDMPQVVEVDPQLGFIDDFKMTHPLTHVVWRPFLTLSFKRGVDRTPAG
jgi:hypothetical protein